jgi:hypothetical protein
VPTSPCVASPQFAILPTTSAPVIDLPIPVRKRFLAGPAPDLAKLSTESKGKEIFLKLRKVNVII